ncbi:MAG: hypothetical protein H8E18_00255, partial [FCB group bacterium]|nr:hypothetical protein [FCB group bacterium]
MRKVFSSIGISIGLVLITAIVFNCGPTPKAAPEVIVDPLRFSDVVAGYKSA